MTEAELYERLLESERQRHAAELRAAVAEAELAHARTALEELQRLEAEELERAERRRSGTRSRMRAFRDRRAAGDEHVTPSDASPSVTAASPSVTGSPSPDGSPNGPPHPHITPSLPSPPPASSVSPSAGDPIADAAERLALDPEQLRAVAEGVAPSGTRQIGEVLEQLPTAYRPPLCSFLAQLRPTRRVAWGHSLAMLLAGEGSKLKPTPEQLGRAVVEIAQNGDDNAALFRGYVRRAIAGELEALEPDPATTATAAAAPRASSSPASSRPQNWRVARGKSLVEASELVAWIRANRHPQYPKSLSPEARQQLTLSSRARWVTAINAVGGVERVLGADADPKLAEQLADVLQSLPPSPEAHAA